MTGERARVERMLFISCVGRSGSTWLGKVLDANPRVLYKYELDKPALYPWFEGVPIRIEPGAADDGARERFAEALRRSVWTHSTRFMQTPRFPKAFVRGPAWRSLEIGLRLTARATGRVARAPIPRLALRPDGIDRVVAKSTISNFRLGWLIKRFPEMKVALLVRHPGGYLASMRRLGWGSFNRIDARSETLRAVCRGRWGGWLERFERAGAFERELIFWLVANDLPLEEAGGAERFMLLRYEDLCRQTHRTLEDLCGFAGIEYCGRMRQMVANTHSTHKRGDRSIWRDPLMVVDRWRTELSDDEREMIGAYLREARIGRLWPTE